jgi:hypothetical protein
MFLTYYKYIDLLIERFPLSSPEPQNFDLRSGIHNVFCFIASTLRNGIVIYTKISNVTF